MINHADNGKLVNMQFEIRLFNSGIDIFNSGIDIPFILIFLMHKIDLLLIKSKIMKNFSNALEQQLALNLNVAKQDYTNPIEYAERAVQLIVESLEKLRTFVKESNFQNKAEEIEFFKIIKPNFLSKLIYFNEIYNLQIGKPSGNHKTIKKYYNNAENRLKDFYIKNNDFYKYYRAGNKSLDKKYFLRRKHDIKLFIDSNFFQADYDFTTSHDFIVAHIIANEAIQQFLEECKRKEMPNNKAIINGEKQHFLKWTGSKVALVELLYAIHASQVINNGQVSINAIAQTAETVFDINLGQFNRIFLEIKSRKSIERTSFLNTLRNNLENKMQESDKM